jgi:predicted transcriptional regulator
MSDIKTTTEIEILVDLDLSKLKNKLSRKIIKNIKKNKLSVTINVDVYDMEYGSIDILSDAVTILKSKKRKKNKKK